MPKTLAPDELNGTFLFPDLDKDLDDLAGLGIGKGDMMEVRRKFDRLERNEAEFLRNSYFIHHILNVDE